MLTILTSVIDIALRVYYMRWTKYFDCVDSIELRPKDRNILKSRIVLGKEKRAQRISMIITSISMLPMSLILEYNHVQISGWYIVLCSLRIIKL